MEDRSSHFTKLQCFKIFTAIAKDSKRSKYVAKMYPDIACKRNSMAIENRDGAGHVTSNIYINLWDINESYGEQVDDALVAGMITQCFHERRHAYQNAVIDTGLCRMTRTSREIANMGVICEFFPRFYKAGYSTDVREIDAELSGIMDAKEYCDRYLPKFDYEAVILQQAREDEMAIIKGDFKDLDALLDAGEQMLRSSYQKTRPYPEARVMADTGCRLDRAFVSVHDKADYEGASGHEQMVMLFDVLMESSFAADVAKRCPALAHRYDIVLKEQFDKKTDHRFLESGMELGLDIDGTAGIGHETGGLEDGR